MVQTSSVRLSCTASESLFTYQRTEPQSALVNIVGLDIQTVDKYRYPGVHQNIKLHWSHNTGVLYKKGKSLFNLLKRIRCFGVSRTLLRTFCSTGSISYPLVVCCGRGRARKRPNKLFRRASSILGCRLDSIEEQGGTRMSAEWKSIIDNTLYPL